MDVNSLLARLGWLKGADRVATVVRILRALAKLRQGGARNEVATANFVAIYISGVLSEGAGDLRNIDEIKLLMREMPLSLMPVEAISGSVMELKRGAYFFPDEFDVYCVAALNEFISKGIAMDRVHRFASRWGQVQWLKERGGAT